MNSYALPSLVALGLCLVPTSDAQPTEPSQLNDPDEIVFVADGGEVSLGALLTVARDEFAAQCFYGQTTDDLNRTLPVVNLGGISRHQFPVFFQETLRAADILHFSSRENGLHQHWLIDLNHHTSPRLAAEWKPRADVVPPDPAACEAAASSLVTTAVRLQHLPAREAVNTLQPYFSSNLTDTIRNVEGTSMIVMTGRRDSVAGVLRLIAMIDVPEALEGVFPHRGRR